MKKLFSLLFLFIFLLAGCGKNKNESEIISKSAANTTYVYITNTGECYHESDCSNIRKSKIKVTLSEAIKKYRECHNCYPPIIEN